MISNSQPHGIPTKYKGVRFRSRLEARWACFFDHCGWPWHYEPIDLCGYIPDFILPFAHEHILVEVKPELTVVGLSAHTRKIEQSGWEKEILVVGASLFDIVDETRPTIGIVSEIQYDDSERVAGRGATVLGRDFDQALMFKCSVCEKISFHHFCHSWHCRVKGCYRGAHHLNDFQDAWNIWTEAGNSVQWRSSAN